MAEWDIDLSEVQGLQQWYKKQPKMMQRASAMMLNRFAWGTRDESVVQIGRLMIVRNKAFVSKMLKVTQTNQSTPISQQVTTAGSIAWTRFSGWVEQEKGTPTDRKRISTVASRAGDRTRQMLPRARLKPSNEVTKIGDGKTPKGGASNYGGFIAMLARQKYKGLIRIKGGFYMFGARPELPGPHRGKARLLGRNKSLLFVQEMKKKQPKQKHWLRIARAVYFKKNPPQQTWAKTVDRLMKPPPKK